MNLTTLRGLLERGTKGPWVVHPVMAWVSSAADLEMPICQMRMATNGETSEPQAIDDAALIVAAVNSLPGLLDMLEEMAGAVEALLERGGAHNALNYSDSIKAAEVANVARATLAKFNALAAGGAASERAKAAVERGR